MTDSESFSEFISELYEQYYSILYNYCYALLDRNCEDAVDCVCDVFITAQKYEAKLKKHPNITGWLKKTAHNRVKRIIRSRSKLRKAEVPMSDTSERYMESLQYIQDFDESTSFDIDNAKDAVLLSLSVEERELYSMRFVQKLTISQIGENLSLSITATRMRLVKLELKLRDLIACYTQE